MTIMDTHAHLSDLADPLKVLRESASAGVTGVVVLGVDLASNQRHLDILKAVLASSQASSQTLEARYPQIYLAFGLHPGNITTADASDACLTFIRQYVHEAAAIGETGLDFWYPQVRKDSVKKQEQREVFQQHLDLAAEFDLPIVIHSRGAWRECLDMTKAAGIRKADFHWYSGPLDVLEAVLDAGFFVSVSPSIEYSPESRRTAEYVPLDRLLVETDTPVAFSGLDGVRRPSTPADVWRTFKALCDIKIETSEALQCVNANARAFFNRAVL